MSTDAQGARLDSAAGWVVALSAALATFAVFGVAYSFGAFFAEIRAEFGVDRSQTSLLFSVTTFAYFTLGIFTGRLADRFGPRRVLLTGAFVMLGGLWLTSMTNNIWLAYLTYGVGVGVGVACAYVPMVAVVGGWFERRRVAALGVAVAGIGVGTLVGSPTAEALVEAYGWRSSYRILAVAATALMLVAAIGARRPPMHADTAELPRLSALMRGRALMFTFLYASVLVLSASLFMPFVYLPDYVSGLGRTGGATLVGIIGGASVVGRLGLGALGAIVPMMRLYQLSFFTMALSYLLWLGSEANPWMLLTFAIVMGLSYGGFIALSPAVAAMLFGPVGLGGVLGALYTAAGVGAMIGPPVLGLLIDASGYNATITIAMLVGFAAVPLLIAAERLARSRPAAFGPQATTQHPPPVSTTAAHPPSGEPVHVPAYQALGPAAIDSVLLLSFGGPEGPDAVTPFLQNVTRGRDVTPERLAKVEMQYLRHGGVSPINAQNRSLLAAVSTELARRGTPLACYWGNRNWHPYLRDTVGQMVAEGRRHAAVIVTSAFSSYSGCRQYHEDLEQAASDVPNAPQLSRIRVYGNHPGFAGAVAGCIREALDGAHLRSDVHALFSAHSLPSPMAASCNYEAELRDVAETVADMAGLAGEIEIVYQSRSGPPQVPWLEPDVNDRLTQLGSQGCRAVLVVPLGFTSDHMEVLVDLDTRARTAAARSGITMVRARTVGTHPLFISALVDLVEETAGLRTDRPTVGHLGPRPDICAPSCCPLGRVG
ncbi:ferrochelatase [Candidatus Poriferisodalis sp.]|uniref:ferrochelatase n=1 Tax=Candidatus Poriferisodalis sp. TaxID=3101277 RepID=UPI003B528841